MIPDRLRFAIAADQTPAPMQPYQLVEPIGFCKPSNKRASGSEVSLVKLKLSASHRLRSWRREEGDEGSCIPNTAMYPTTVRTRGRKAHWGHLLRISFPAASTAARPAASAAAACIRSWAPDAAWPIAATRVRLGGLEQPLIRALVPRNTSP